MGYIKYVHVKVGKMRKADSCVVYPHPQNNIATVQGGRLIMRVDLTTGKGIYNYRCSGHNGTDQLSKPGAMFVVLDAETLEKIKDSVPQSGDYVGSNVCRIL